MADLYFKIIADTKELDEAYKKLDQMGKLSDELMRKLSSADPGSKEFKELNKQLSALEKQYEATVKKVAQLEGKLAGMTGKTANSVLASSNIEAGAYESVTATIQQVLGVRNQNLTLLAREEAAIKQVASERRALEQLERNNAITAKEAARQRAGLIDRETQHKEAASDLRMTIIAETKEMQAADTSMRQMSLTLGRMREAYRQLSETERNSAFGQQLQKDIHGLNQKMITLDAAIGNHQRNVGNYASSWNGLSYSIQQVVRELPSLSFGFGTFMNAIGNNVPMAADELRKAIMEYKAYLATIKSGATDIPKVAPVWKQLASSIFSWQTALVVGITLLTVYGKDLINWAQKLMRVDDSQSKLNKSIGEFNTALLKEKSALRSVFTALLKSNEGTEGRRKAINEVNTLYGKYLPHLLSEKSSLDEINKAYRKITSAILENTAAKAQAQAIEKATEENIERQTERMDSLGKKIKKGFNVTTDEELNNLMDSVRKSIENSLGKGENSIQAALGGLSVLDEKKPTAYVYDRKGIYDEIRAYAKDIYEYYDTVNQIQKKYNPFFNKEEADKAVVQNKQYFESIKQQAVSVLESIAPTQKTLLDTGNTLGIDPAVVIAYKKAKVDIAKADEALKVYDPYEKKQKESDKLLSITGKLNRSILDSELKLQSGRIAIMEDGKAKRIALAKQETRDTIAAIQKEKEEYRQKAKESKEKVDPTVIKTFDDRELAAKAKEKADIARVEKEYADEYRQRTKALTDVFLNEEERKLSAIKTRYAEERKWADDQLRTGGMTKEEHTSYSVNINNAEQQETYRSLLDNLNDYKQKEKDIRDKWDTDINAAVEAKDAFLVAKLQEGKQKALSTLNFQMLQESAEWMRLFGNLDTLTVDELNKLIDSIQSQLDSGALTLNPVDAKALIDSLNEAKEKVAEKSPFQALAKSSGEMKKALADLRKAEDEGLSGEQLDSYKKKVKDSADNVKKSITAIGDAYGQVSDVMKSAAELIGMVDEGLGETVNNAISLGDAVMNVGEVVANAVIAFAAGMNAMESASVILLVIKAVIMAVMAAISLFNGDKRHEKKIKELQDQAEVLERSYDNLGKSIEKVFSKDASKLIDQQNKLLEQQKVLIQQQIREEEAKKKTDNDKIKDWKNQIEDINNTIAENKEKAVDAIFGEDLKSAIENFADAYANAWASGEDRAKSAKDTVRNMMRQMVTESIKAAMESSKAMEQIRTKLEEFYADNVLSGWEKDYIYKMAEGLQSELDDKFGWADSLMKDNEPKDGVSGQLQAAMTEGTASQLVGLWNSTSIDMRELKQISLANGETVSSILTDVSEIMRQNILIEQNTRRGADNTDGLIDELQSGFNALDRRLGEIERNTKVSKSRG